MRSRFVILNDQLCVNLNIHSCSDTSPVCTIKTGWKVKVTCFLCFLLTVHHNQILSDNRMPHYHERANIQPQPIRIHRSKEKDERDMVEGFKTKSVVKQKKLVYID